MHSDSPIAAVEGCPVCGGDGEVRELWQADDSRAALKRLFGDRSADALQLPDYRLCVCRSCTLGYSSPMIPGDAGFYTWLTAQRAYYNESRWEWTRVGELVAEHFKAARGVTLADLGCGSGQFLKMLPQGNDCRLIGIDSSPRSVAAGRSAGLDIHLGDWQLLRDLCPGGLDYVTGFHCLEHLSEPVAFVRNCAELLGPDGRLFVSTPLYPSSTEEGWQDPLNAPPHHLTRWNVKATQALADAADCEVRIHLPPAAGVFSRTLRVYRFALSTPFAALGVSRRRRILYSMIGALARPWTALKLLATQVARERIDHQVAPDVILMEFTRRIKPETATSS